MRKIITTILLTISILFADAQVKKLAGPRVGMTIVQAGSLASLLRKDVPLEFGDDAPIRQEWTGSTGKYGAVMSQYGWQWETRFSDGGEVTGIIEWIALVGGMEKGEFFPSVSSLAGLRSKHGYEFAAGPNLSMGGIAMVVGAGYNFKFGRLNLPVNIAYVPSINKTYENGVTHPTGARVSIMVGFNLSK